MPSINLKKILLAIKSANLWAMALCIIFLFFISPIVFSLLDTKPSTYLFINRSVGLSVSYNFIAIMMISLLAAKHYWLHELTYGKAWIFGLIGSLLFTILYINYANALMIKVSLAIWVCLVSTISFIQLIKTKRKSKKEQHLEHEYNQFDQSTIFDPAKSNASHIIEVKHIEGGDAFGDFLLNQNIKLEILSIAQHGGYLLKVTQLEHVAYARTINLSLDRHQRFWDDGEKQNLPKQQIWNIEIAFTGNTESLHANVLSAVLEMNKHYPAKLIHDIKVRTYQNLNTLFDHNHSLRLPGNKKLIHLAYHNKQLEIETEHEFEDTKVKYFRATTVWLNDGRLICSESKSINEDITVSTEDVPLAYFDLPFEGCRLKYIEVQESGQSNVHPTILVLTIEDTNKSHSTKLELQKLSIDLAANPIYIKLLSNESYKELSIADYRKQQCFFQY